MNDKEILIKTRAALLERGWTQGKFQSRTGEVCLLGAINLVVSGRADMPSAASGSVRDKLRNIILHEDEQFLSDWNDKEGRNAYEVFNLLDKAIASEP